MTQSAPADLLDSAALARASTDALKQTLLNFTQNADTDPIGKKTKLAKQLSPLFNELSRRNPTPDPREQVPLVLGTWRSLWSTIPFQDMLPGRLREQSYQVFADNGYYANSARYKPGSDLPLLNQVSRWLVSLDLMILQTYDAGPDGWRIENVGIDQAVRLGAQPFTGDAARRWFDQAAAKAIADAENKAGQHVDQNQTSATNQANLAGPNLADSNLASPNLTGMDARTAKRFETVFRSQPQLEHLYIDRDFRLVKSRREANQRPSYTVAIRCEA
ncbi:MAG: hypothetical protein ACFB5Z_18160 [Elainellaceae cyanobacterium]